MESLTLFIYAAETGTLYYFQSLESLSSHPFHGFCLTVSLQRYLEILYQELSGCIGPLCWLGLLGIYPMFSQSSMHYPQLYSYYNSTNL